MLKIMNESNNLSDFRGNSRAGNATRVRIKATGRTGWVESVVDDKWGQGIRVIYDDRPGMWPDFFTVDEVEILEPVKKPKTESFDDDFEQYTYVKSKDVNDADGYLTEYTMYYDEVEDRYVFVFGDSDIYNPNDGYEEFDYECDTEREADEWFDNYEGFEDLDEGYKNMKPHLKEVQERLYAEVQVGMKWVDDEFYKQCNKISGNKAWIETRWNSIDSDEEHRETSVWNITEGENCDVLVDPEYADEWYGKLYVNAAINLEQFYPNYWNDVLGKTADENLKESVYTDAGFDSRKDYLNSLADDFGIDKNTVYDLASVLGPEEDFDALVTELEDMADDLEETEDFDPIKHYLDNYAYVVCSTDNTYENFDFIFPYDTYEFAGKELARDLIEYKTETCIFDTRNKTKTDYSPNKLDISKLDEGGRHGWVEDNADYIDPEIVGKDTAIENIRNILDMCEVKTEKY